MTFEDVNWVAPSSDSNKSITEVLITFYFIQVTTQRHQVNSVYWFRIMDLVIRVIARKV